MPGVRVRESEHFDAALRRFKRSCEKAGVLTELRRRENTRMLADVSRAMEESLDLPVREAVRKTVTVLVETHAVDARLGWALRELVPDDAIADQTREIESTLFRLGMEFARRRGAGQLLCGAGGLAPE